MPAETPSVSCQRRVRGNLKLGNCNGKTEHAFETACHDDDKGDSREVEEGIHFDAEGEGVGYTAEGPLSLD